MTETDAMDVFAPFILEKYLAGPEEFWDAAMAPFLSGGIGSIWKNRSLYLELLSAFNGVDSAVKRYLAKFGKKNGIDLLRWKNLRQKEEYFRDAYPVYAFLAIWMNGQAMKEEIGRFGDILRSVAFGIAGYGVLDSIVDGDRLEPVQLLAAQAMISEYETGILEVFGVTGNNLAIIHNIRKRFLAAEIREKSLRFKKSPYTPDNPEGCGYKAAHLLTPFMLSLEKTGKSEFTEDYFSVFFKFGAVIQIMDDIKDLEVDILQGHYSFVTLDWDMHEMMKKRRPKDIAREIREDNKTLERVSAVCRTLIADSRAILEKLGDQLLERIVNVTESRMEKLFGDK